MMHTTSNDPLLLTLSDLEMTSTDLDHQLSPIRNWHTLLMVYVYIVVVVGIIGNILLLTAYVKFPSLHNPTNLLICNQSFADLMSCALGLSYVWFNYTLWGLDVVSKYRYVCLVSLCVLVLSVWSSLVNLMALTVERFLAVVFPFHYLRWVTETSVKKVIAAVWGMLVVLTSLPVLGWNTWRAGNQCVAIHSFTYVYFVYFFLLPSLLGMIMMAVLNAVICTIAVSMRKVSPHAPPQAPVSDASTPPGGNFKVTKMLLKVVGVFYMCWMPYTILTIVSFTPPDSWKRGGVPEWTQATFEFTKGLLMVNSAVNPLIYATSDARFRNAFKTLLRLKTRE